MGGGFNGFCLAIIDPIYKKKIIKTIKSKYLELHPEYKNKIKIIICTSEDGVGR